MMAPLLLTYTPRAIDLRLFELSAACKELRKVNEFVDATLERMIGRSKDLQDKIKELSDLANSVHLIYASAVHSTEGRTVYVGEEKLGIRSLLEHPSPALSTLETAQVKAYYRKLSSHYHPNSASQHASADMQSVVYAAYKAGNLEILYLLAAVAGLTVQACPINPDMLIRTAQRKLEQLKAQRSFRIAAQSVTGPVGNLKAHLGLLSAILEAKRKLVITLTKKAHYHEEATQVQ